MTVIAVNESRNLSWTMALIKKLNSSCFTGRLVINFRLGGVADVEQIERLQPPKGDNPENN